MFNSAKNSEIKENAGHLVDHARIRASKVAKDAKSAAGKISRSVSATSRQTRKEAAALLDTLRDVIDPKEANSIIEQIAETVVDNLADWKDVAQNEITHAYKSGKIQSRRFVHKRTLLAISLAVGAGALIGYLASGSAEHE